MNGLDSVVLATVPILAAGPFRQDHKYLQASEERSAIALYRMKLDF